MANSKKKAVTKPAAKKPAAPAKKTAAAKTPAKPKTTKPTATKAATVIPKKAAAKTSAKKPAATPKPAPKSPKSNAKPAPASKGSRLQLDKASTAKAPAKSGAAKKVSPKSTASTVAATPQKKAAKKPEPSASTRVATAASARAASSERKAALATKASAVIADAPLPSSVVGKKLRTSTSGSSGAKPLLRTSSGGGSADSVQTRAATSARASAAKAVLRTPPARPVSFTLDEVRAIAKSNEAKSEPATKASTAKSPKKTSTAAATPTKVLKSADIVPPAKPSHVKAASLADILGFNPNAKGPEAAGPVPREVALVPEKFKRYYKLLVELREHLTGQIDQHSEDTLKRSSKDDAGDLSSYGQHMADAGTDTFDRDFALSLVSSEQEALSEIEAAIKRITDGSYGVCEVTGQPIAKARLLAVPFTRYSAEAQKEIERNHYRVRTQAGLFGELGGEDGGKIMDADSD